MTNGMRALAEAHGLLPVPSTAPLDGGHVDYVRAGAGAPTIVLLTDARLSPSSWALVLPELAEFTTVFAADPHMLGALEPSGAPLTGTALVERTRTLLRSIGLGPPYVLAGHGLGGLHANLWARLHPHEVTGVVLVESSHPDDDLYERRLRFLPRTLLRASLAIGGATTRNGAERILQLTSAEVAAAPAFPPVPLIVLTGGRTGSGLTVSPAQAATHSERQRQLAGLSPHGELVVAPRAAYLPQVDDPEIVMRAIRKLALRTETP